MLPTIEPSVHDDQVSNHFFKRPPDTPDCLHYTRTGFCNYGLSCRFNHPPLNKMLESDAPGLKEDYPERLGEPECQFYLKTGACKFGLACKYHHPKEKAGILGKAFINEAGYPLRLGEKDCAYYMQTGTCKFGTICKFNHPQPACFPRQIYGKPMYTSADAHISSSLPGSSWAIPRIPYFPGFPPQRPCFPPMLVPSSGFLSMLWWTTSQGLIRPLMPTSHVEIKHQTINATTTCEGDLSQNVHGPNSSYIGCNAATNYMYSSLMPKDSVYPERPGQPECKYFLKTGDCKFGTSCWFDHPKKRSLLPPSCSLSPLGLPQRPGTEPCTFYLRYGTCKFGSSCRYNHPWNNNISSSPPAKSMINCTFSPYPLMHIVPKPFQPRVETINAAAIQDNETTENEELHSDLAVPGPEHSSNEDATSSM